MKLGLFLILFLLFISLVTAAPELPLIVNGDVKINNKDAPIGAVITAEMGNEVVAVFTVGKEGEYAFVVNKKDEIKNNTVTFYINGIKTEESTEWQSGKVAKIDLSVKKGDKITGFAVGKITTNNVAAISLLAVAIIITLLIIFIAVKRVKKK